MNNNIIDSSTKGNVNNSADFNFLTAIFNAIKTCLKAIHEEVCLASFAISVVVSAIVERLRKSGNEKEILIPKKQSRELIEAIGEKNPALGQKLSKAFDDDDYYEEKKMGFVFDANNEIVNVEKIKARDTSEDDIQDVTSVFSSGKYKTYA